MPDYNIPRRILFYNWVQFDDENNTGGGVTVYLRNLLSALAEKNFNIDLFFLSSGYKYDYKSNETFIRETENALGKKCRSFEVVNSPVMAPASWMSNNPENIFCSPKLKAVITDFFENQGPFFVVHFNNIEGLSLDVLSLKNAYTDTKFLFSLHNYVPICPTNFYFQFNKKRNCTPNEIGAECLNCVKYYGRKSFSSEALRRAEISSKGKPNKDWISHHMLNKLDERVTKETYKRYRKEMVEALNKHIDYYIAVSEKVKEIYVGCGFDLKKIKRLYIGTKAAEEQCRKSAIESADSFKITFLGYATVVEKGFPFLLSALSRLESEYKSKIDILIAARGGDRNAIRKRLSGFKSVRVLNGYTHEQLPILLSDVHLGIIPVLWEDNLPQVAIEMVAMGVPILSSSFGGASELCESELFKFEGGNTEDFLAHLKRLIDKPNLLNEYWKYHGGLTTMKMHIKELMELYAIPFNDDNETYYNTAKKKNVISISQKEHDTLLDIIGLNNTLEEENHILNQNIKNMEKQVRRLKNENEELLDQIKKIHSSISFKLGCILTFIPRKVRGGIRCYKENGVSYTWQRIKQKLNIEIR